MARRHPSPLLRIWTAGILVVMALGPATAGKAPVLRLLGQLSDGPADRVSADGDRVVFGSGQRIWLARGSVNLVVERRTAGDSEGERVGSD